MTDQDPKCDRCGATVTTGMMAVFCPRSEKCEFWPADESSQEFIQSLRNTATAIRQDGEPS